MMSNTSAWTPFAENICPSYSGYMRTYAALLLIRRGEAR